MDPICIHFTSIDNPVTRARAFAMYAHLGQVDKTGKPYFDHVERVALGVDGPTEKQAAYLHDVLEDTHHTEDTLRQLGFQEEVIRVVKLLTKPKGEDVRLGHPYFDRIKADPMARAVKLSDLNDNMNLGRFDAPAERDFERVRRYAEIKAYVRG